MRRDIGYLVGSSVIGLATACGGGGGGTPSGSVGVDGVAMICTGKYVNSDTGEEVHFPCKFDPTTGDCVFIPVENHNALSCATDETIDGKAVLPGFNDPDALTDGYCACKDRNLPEAEQDGTCETVCEEIMLNSPNFNNGDPGGPWHCEGVEKSPNGEKPLLECVHGSIVYFNGGPSDYTAQLVGTQTTTGFFDYGIGSTSSSGDGNVDGLLRFSFDDRSLGCAAGCPMTVSELGLVLHPFSVPGIDLLAFTWGGASMDTTGVANQGMLRGRVYDDGQFELDAEQGSLVVDYRGDYSGKFAKALDRKLTGHIDFSTNAVTLDGVTLSGGDAKIVIHTLNGGAVRTPPSPVIATAAVQECQSSSGTNVVLDATGTSDLEGGPINYAWAIDGALIGYESSLNVNLSLGAHDVQLTATDSTLGRASSRLALTITDTVPPELSLVPASIATCGTELVHFPQPSVQDTCSASVSLSGAIVAIDGTSITPIALDGDSAIVAPGVVTVRWTATDGSGNTSDADQDFTVGDNTPPVIECPAGVTEECIDGAAIVDYDVSATDDCSVESLSCAPPSGSSFDLGTTPVGCTASDPSGNSSSCAFDVDVVDTQPPSVTVAGGGSLWPPTTEYATKSLFDCGIEIDDLCQGAIALADAKPKIACVTSDEPDDTTKKGDASTLNDMIIVNDTTVKLRAERSGRLDGRVYSIHFQVTDLAGNTAEGVCKVGVPPTEHGTAVDSGSANRVGTCP
ncbi:MAG TPA: HYR domain-containing protein [Polyangiaceae bacterium]|nr:HYR domain-containing protein [Polyangiaceae bacterium]